MKVAVALINVPDDADINELCITFDLERMLNQDGDVETIWGGISEPLRPLPCKKHMRQMPSDVLEKGKRKRDFIIHKVDVDNSYVEGWNDCLDEITGETG